MEKQNKKNDNNKNTKTTTRNVCSRNKNDI